MNRDGLDFKEESFLRLKQVHAAPRLGADDLWTHRVSLFCHMVETAYAPKNKRFKFGLLSCSVWLLIRILAQSEIERVCRVTAGFSRPDRTAAK
jgi:hypothetical protein